MLYLYMIFRFWYFILNSDRIFLYIPFMGRILQDACLLFRKGGTVLWIWQNSFCLDFWCICTCVSVQLRFIEFAFHGIIEMKCRQAVAWRNGRIVYGSNQMNKKENIITRIFLIYKSLLIQILCLFDLLYDKKIRLRFGIVRSGAQTAL